MLSVRFHRDSRNRLSSIFATGHADAGAFGEDIVCAAVSAVLQAARLGLEEYAALDIVAVQAPGDFSVTLPEHGRDDPAAKAIVATAELAVKQIARQYPVHLCVTQTNETGYDRPSSKEK
ncbi:MAG: ribosomal-processing cysteine protease Prp [Candidatus Eremiobacteraeota bacterium]|nr:ribosomal-processing cysteine protease Prp [Candidatus Eremiobacteraeota bacterium]